MDFAEILNFFFVGVCCYFVVERIIDNKKSTEQKIYDAAFNGSKDNSEAFYGILTVLIGLILATKGDSRKLAGNVILNINKALKIKEEIDEEEAEKIK